VPVLLVWLNSGSMKVLSHKKRLELYSVWYMANGHFMFGGDRGLPFCLTDSAKLNLFVNDAQSPIPIPMPPEVHSKIILDVEVLLGSLYRTSL
jgi:hypothetical protein